MSVVETLVSGIGLAFGHVAGELVPHSRGGLLARLSPRHWLNVDRDAFFDPVLVPGHAGKCQVDHLMGQHPVVIQFVNFSFSSHRNHNQAAVSGIGDTVMNAGAVVGANSQGEMRHRKAPVILRDIVGGVFYPMHQVVASGRHWIIGQSNVNLAIGHLHGCFVRGRRG